MCRPREGDDRGRWLLFFPAEPLELVARPHLRRPAAVRVRRPCIPAEGLAARTAHGRRLDGRGVRRDPGRTAPLPVRIHEGTAGGGGPGGGGRKSPVEPKAEPRPPSLPPSEMA